MAQLSKHTTPDGVETRHMARLSKHTTPDGVKTRHMANISINFAKFQNFKMHVSF